ncbi:hypothetical protein [Mycobacteroides abscessus]|uniref:hypothetical protein n=1 Tax=Mycobacteroides abscessus TaxID=36809 RepID=UPI0021022A3F|nr:hypothetical protein [Mycobacteroides abscessus]
MPTSPKRTKNSPRAITKGDAQGTVAQAEEQLRHWCAEVQGMIAERDKRVQHAYDVGVDIARIAELTGLSRDHVRAILGIKTRPDPEERLTEYRTRKAHIDAERDEIVRSAYAGGEGLSIHRIHQLSGLGRPVIYKIVGRGPSAQGADEG